jgi:DUF4097 and DUF4098 domain-containing protein YvlB
VGVSPLTPTPHPGDAAVPGSKQPEISFEGNLTVSAGASVKPKDVNGRVQVAVLNVHEAVRHKFGPPGAAFLE